MVDTHRREGDPAEGVGEVDRGPLQALGIARALGLPVSQLEQVCAGEQAGEDCGTTFFLYSLDHRADLVVRADGLRAYVRGLRAEEFDREVLCEALVACGLDTGALTHFDKPASDEEWVLVAEGRAAEAAHAEAVDFCWPGRNGKELLLDHLQLSSARLYQLYTAGDLQSDQVQKIPAPIVVPGEVVGRIRERTGGKAGRDIFGRVLAPPVETPGIFLQPGDTLSLSEEGEYLAEQYGYLCLVEGQMTILPPLWISADRMKVFWILLDRRPLPLTLRHISAYLSDLGVVYGVKEDKVEALVKMVRRGAHARGLYLVAEGRKPVPGRDAEVELLADERQLASRQSGWEREDGSMDFDIDELAANVEVGQCLARRRPATQGIDGKDVLGYTLRTADGIDHPLKAGSHVQREIRDGVEQYRAECQGLVRFDARTLSVYPVLVIEGNVDYHTGNLEFDGHVFVKGTIFQGFEVHAGGDIVVAGAVEMGGRLVSQGDIIVGRGIVGRRTQITARGNVRVQFVQDATVVAGKDIVVGDSANQAQLRAGGSVQIRKNSGPTSGACTGGQIWALQEIDIYLAGSATGVTTFLGAGMSLEHAEELDKLERRIGLVSQQIMRLLRHFGLERVDPEQIRNRIAAASASRRKVMARHVRQLNEFAQVYKALLAERRELKERMGANVSRAQIRVRERIEPGVEIRLGEKRQRLSEAAEGICFRLEDGELVLI